MSVESERYLAYLCNKTFLSLWSFPNVFKDNKKIGKEICDLLVVFGNDVIIFSDKSCKYKNTNNLTIDWNRWYKKSILESSVQLYGAERWIKEHPNRLFTDSKAKIPFPIDLPNAIDMRIHRIAVALGTAEQCRAFYRKNSGSLRINTSLSPIMKDDTENHKAFTIANFDKSKGYVHVFDDVTLDIIMSELDTVSDFCTYLRKKEELINKATVIASGEEDILSEYLKNIDQDGQHGFNIDHNIMKQDILVFTEGGWERLSCNPQYIAKKKQNEVSMIWDKIIEHFNQMHREGRLREGIITHEYEKPMRKMAALNRIERRIVGKQLETIIQTTSKEQKRYSAILVNTRPNLAIAFVLWPKNRNQIYAKYVKERREVLEAYSRIVKYKNPHITEVIGFTSEPYEQGEDSSQDIAYFDFSVWSKEDEMQAEIDMQTLDFKGTSTPFHEDEYLHVAIKPTPLLNRHERRKQAKLKSKKPS